MAIERIETFLAIVEAGSIQGAAKRLRVSRATVRSRLDDLEAEARVPLLERGRHGVRPTPAGSWLAQQGKGLLTTASALLEAAREMDEEPSGPLRLATMAGTSPDLAAFVSEILTQRFPRVSLFATDRPDPVSALRSGEADVAAGFVPPTLPAGLEALMVMDVPIRLVASQRYLAAHGAPSGPDALTEHPLLLWTDGFMPTDSLPLGEGRLLRITPRVVSNNILTIRALAGRGAGIAFAPDGLSPVIAKPELIRILEDQVGAQRQIGVVVPSVIRDVPRVRALLETLVSLTQRFRSVS